MNDYGSTVWRICMSFFSQKQDAQDAFQETFLKYALADSVVFNDSEHRKAWLITVASNICRDMLKVSYRKDVAFDETYEEKLAVPAQSEDCPGSRHNEIIEAFRALDDPPRLPVFLSLYEGYTAPEIAEMLDAPVNTVYSWIARGKKLLKEALS